MRWFLLSLALIVGAAQSQEGPKPKGTQERSKADQRGSEKSPLFVKTPNPTTQVERDYEAYEKYQKPWNETALAYATIALSVITLALAVFTALLWVATYRLVRGAKNTAERELRAYAMVSCAKIVNASGGRPGHLIDISIKNFGKTPATSAKYWVHVRESIFRHTGVVLKKDPVVKEFTAGVIAPGDTFTTSAEIPLLLEGDQVSSGYYALYVYGTFSYTDAFERPRTTEFRFMRRGPGWLSEGEMEICQEGNEIT